MGSRLRGNKPQGGWVRNSLRIIISHAAETRYPQCDIHLSSRTILIWAARNFTILHLKRMVGGMMMSPIMIPWFRRTGPSWSQVYLVKGGSRPNLTEGSLSAAMGFDVIGKHTGAGHNRYIVVPFGGRITQFRGPRVITVYPAVPFGGKTAERYVNFNLFEIF
ncbi:hypothetical protein M5K25_012358 [Dendrobium thyrsiflorum]|uniref:Uncharacterized protein n=1 Tax=Dendrobium thyrsiflorum TaxID=117978 RepID=A0ABD0UXI7_DENTH